MSDTSASSASSCCVVDTAPDTHTNDPGQDQVRYRVGEWADFYRRMKLSLSRYEVEDDQGQSSRPLASLTTRADDDPAIALLDAWSVVLDVLTFYQERIANEGFLRTATERRSVLELARAIGYELSPGVAASTRLAFTVEDAKGAPGSATIPVGLGVLSIPGQDETPQTFETVEEREVRAEWNALKPLCWEAQPIALGTTECFVEGVSSRLQPGDAILIVGDERAEVVDDATEPTQDERWDFRILTEVETFPEDNYTRLAWSEGLGWSGFGHTVNPAAINPRLYALRARTGIFGHNAVPWLALDVTSRVTWYEHYTGDTLPTDPTTDADFKATKEWPGEGFKRIYNDTDPDGDAYEDHERVVDLDGEHKGVVADGWVVFLQGKDVELGQILSVSFETRSDFGLSAKVTRLEIDTYEAAEAAASVGLEEGEEPEVDDGLSIFRRRRTVAFAQTEELTWAQRPIEDPFPTDEEIASGVEIDGLVEGLEVGQYLFLTGETVESTVEDGETTWTGTGETESELCQIASVSTSGDGRTVILLASAPENRYLRSSVSMNANVVLATHGETVTDEVLGSGDGSVSNPSFELRKYPLTYVSAATASGAQSTLELSVDGVDWTEVSSLYEQESDAEVFIVRIDDEARATVTMGDGTQGARLPTGAENVNATYRFGLGLAGNVDADKLQLMKKRPLGVRSVTNPRAASGGEDPESLDDARDNAPLTVLTVDRLVSLSDYEDFARAFAGVAKAAAVEVWNGERRLVHLTVAGTDGAVFSADDETVVNLLAAIKTYGDPTQRVKIDSYTPRYFRVAAELSVDAAYETEDVYAAVTEALQEAFSFDERAFAQAVTAAEVVAILQAVDGVVAVDLNSLELLEAGYDPDEVEDEATSTVDEDTAELSFSAVRLASRARWNGTTVEPAELLLLDTSALAVSLEEMN